MNRINALKSLPPQKRFDSLAERYEKNLAYFKEHHPDIHRGLTTYRFPYEVVVTEDFLDIVDNTTGKTCFPEIALDKLAKAQGELTSKTWTDLLDLKLKTFPPDLCHSTVVHRFNERMFKAFPQFRERFLKQNIYLSDGSGQKKYSNPVIFLGLFHGLHLDYYLSQVHLHAALFIEPEPERFETSCYFLDYAELDEKLDGLLIHVGPQPPNNLIRNFFQKSFITSAVWLRVLVGYSSEANGQLLHNLQKRWRSLADQWFPADWRIAGHQSVHQNLAAGRALFTDPPTLSKQSKIVIVGAGPSLNTELNFLRKNRDKLIIFAVHSAIGTLQEAHIVPDFQFCLDIHLQPELILNVHTFHLDIPTIFEIRTNPPCLGVFHRPLLVADADEDYPVQFTYGITGTQPTTGNLCTSFAVHCTPQEIYLIGMDFAFREVEKSHASGGVYDRTGMQKRGAGKEQIPVSPNFPDSGSLITRPYFDEARIRVEDLLLRKGSRLNIYNLSDGARIKQTVPRRAHKIKLPGYKKRQDDIRKILDSFQAVSPQKDWHEYKTSDEDLRNNFFAILKKQLLRKRFTWEDYGRSIDKVLVEATIAQQKVEPADNRLRVYNDVTRDLLINWYKYMVFTLTVDEAERLFQLGSDYLLDALADFFPKKKIKNTKETPI